MSTPPRIAFASCVQLGYDCLKVALASDFHFDLVITLADDVSIKKSGRVFFDQLCSDYCVPLIKVSHINDLLLQHNEAIAGIDLLFLVGWSQIDSNHLVTMFPLGTIELIYPLASG